MITDWLGSRGFELLLVVMAFLLLLLSLNMMLGCSGTQPTGPAFAFEEAGGEGFGTVRLWGQRLHFETKHIALGTEGDEGAVYCPVFVFEVGEPGASMRVEGALSSSAPECFERFGKLDPFQPGPVE
jgi:hypothetical protein